MDQVAISLRRGTLIDKIDIKLAYHLVPMYPTDRRWLGTIEYLLTGCCHLVCAQPATLWQVQSSGVWHEKVWSTSSITWMILLCWAHLSLVPHQLDVIQVLNDVNSHQINQQFKHFHDPLWLCIAMS